MMLLASILGRARRRFCQGMGVVIFRFGAIFAAICGYRCFVRLVFAKSRIGK